MLRKKLRAFSHKQKFFLFTVIICSLYKTSLSDGISLVHQAVWYRHFSNQRRLLSSFGRESVDTGEI